MRHGSARRGWRWSEEKRRTKRARLLRCVYLSGWLTSNAYGIKRTFVRTCRRGCAYLLVVALRWRRPARSTTSLRPDDGLTEAMLHVLCLLGTRPQRVTCFDAAKWYRRGGCLACRRLRSVAQGQMRVPRRRDCAVRQRHWRFTESSVAARLSASRSCSTSPGCPARWCARRRRARHGADGKKKSRSRPTSAARRSHRLLAKGWAQTHARRMERESGVEDGNLWTVGRETGSSA